MEINGFEIDIENQYNLDENKKVSTCPLCSETRKKKTDKCLMVDWDRGLSYCNHCGKTIQLHTFKKKDRDSDKEYIKPPFVNKTNLSDKVVEWFQEKRGISQKALGYLKITTGLEWMPQTKKNENTIQFNYFRDDELINIKYRDGAKNFKLYKDAEKIFYNIDCLRNYKEVVIVEGEMDVLSYVEAGIHNVISVPNGSTKNKVNLDYLDSCIDEFKNINRVYLALDNDEAGQNVQKEFIRRLGAEKCYLIDLLEVKDANEFLLKYGVNELKETLSKAKIIPLENVKTINDNLDELLDFYKNGMPKGYITGIKSFDNIFSTYTSQYVVVTGVSGSGKSEFVDSMCVGYNMNYDWKGTFVSPENKPDFLHSDKLVRKFYGTTPNEGSFNKNVFGSIIDHINNNFFFIDFEQGYDLDECLDKIKELVIRKGIRYFVLDPFNKITMKGIPRDKITEYTTAYLNKIDVFCKKYDLLGIIVAHPVKQSKNEQGEYNTISMYQIKGGGEFYDMSYHGISVNRLYKEQYVEVTALKVKFANLGENNGICELSFNTVNGRYFDRYDEQDYSPLFYIEGEKEEEPPPAPEEYNNNLITTNNEFENVPF